MYVKQFVKKNKYSFLLLLFLLTVVVSISASFTLSKYTRTVSVQELEIEVTNKWPILYRGFATEKEQKEKLPELDSVTQIVMGSFDTYKNQLNLIDDDWTSRDKKYWVQQESAQNPEGKNLRGGIRLFFDPNDNTTAYVLAKESYPVIFPIDSHSMFADLTKVAGIDFNNIDTTLVTNMYQMFWACTAIPTLDLSSFDTSKVTNMWAMFGYCTGLTELSLYHFNTSKVTDMSQMFQGCYNLAKLDISKFDTTMFCT